MNPPAPDLTQFVGHFHPLLVHLPIGFLVLLGVIELLTLLPRFQHLAGLRGVVATLIVPAAALTALCGWLLSQAGGYDAHLLQWHKWSGFVVAAASLVTWLLLRARRLAAYRVCLFGACATVLFASHYGGSLTHGSDYLTRYAPASLQALLGGKAAAPPPAQPVGAPAADPPVFTAAIQPVFNQYCVGCHGPEKAKAELRLDTLDGVRKGGESGPLLGAAQAAAGPLLKRLLLPAAADDHMPPDGKPQPSADDVALIRWWAEAGADTTKTAPQLNPPDQIRLILQARKVLTAAANPAPPPVAPRPAAEVLPLALQLADELGISITPLGRDEPWLQANASLATTNFGDAELARLARLGANLRWLDLAGTRVTDAGLAGLAGMNNLTRLHLERTGLSDAGLACLAGLRNLEYLNLYGTRVTDAGLAPLKPLHGLRHVYLWQTRATPEGAKAFQEAVMDTAQIQRWQEEIASLSAKIRSHTVLVETGVVAQVAATNVPAKIASTNAAPANTVCPVSGKPVDATKTAAYEGRVVAFCCDNCKAAFEKDPKPHLAKLALTAPVADKKEATPPAQASGSK